MGEEGRPMADEARTAGRNATGGRVLSRRALLETAARWTGLALVGAGVAWLVGRRVTATREEVARSDAAGLCGRCGRLEDCSLPLAATARRQGAGLIGPVRRAAGEGQAGVERPLCGKSGAI